MSVSFCLPHPVAVSAFMICRGLCACTEMLWMCVLYVSFGSKVRPRTFGCVAMGSALLFIVRSRLLVYSAGSGVNRVQVVLSGFSTMPLPNHHRKNIYNPVRSADEWFTVFRVSVRQAMGCGVCVTNRPRWVIGRACVVKCSCDLSMEVNYETFLGASS